jgi:UDP-2,3-diacylglucosamine hydrolase
LKATYFISDLHLGASYLGSTHDKERQIVDFLMSIKEDADELYLLGDILDYWFEYRTVAPRGYLRFFGALATLADAGVKIKWFIGNHDIWLFDYLANEIGLEVVDGVVVEQIKGKKFLLSHGDGVGKLPRGFRFIRSVFRNRVCQKLYSAIHPRWTIPFAHGWSRHSRLAELEPTPWRGEQEPLLSYAQTTLQADPSIDYFVFGHRHLMIDQELSPTSRLIVLGDWLSHYSYARFDGTSLQLLQFRACSPCAI